MIHVLIRRRVHEAKWLLLACSVAMIWFCWVRVWIVSRVDTTRFKQILDLLPDDWQKFLTVDFTWMITYAGRVSLAYEELVVVGCISIWAIARGSDCVSGELGRGTTEMLLAQPISRFAVITSQAVVTILGTAVVAGSSWVGNWLGILTTSARQEVTAAWQLPIPLPLIGSEIPIPFAEPKTVYTPMTELVDASLFLPATVNLFAFGLMIAGFSSLMSSWDRYRWRTIGIVIGVYFLQSMAKLAGMAIEEASWLCYLTAFTAYEPELAVRVADLTPEFAWSFAITAEDGSWQAYGPMTYHCLLGGLGVLFYALAVWIFRRRDLPAPL